MKHVVVLGAGFAGLAAAVKLTELGHRVTLVERRHQAGGRAFSFVDSTTGDTVDNGQHLFMKCYHQTLDLFQSIGAKKDICFQDAFGIEFRHPSGGPYHLRFPKFLPPPLNLLAGFIRFGAVNLKDVLPLRKLKPELKKILPIDLSVTEWLTRCQQTPRLREAFWNPLCLAALNEHPDRASARLLQAVLVEGFFDSPDGALLGHSRMGLTNLLSTRAEAFLEQNNQVIEFGVSVRKIEVSDGQRISLHFSNGKVRSPDAVISALPPHALSSLLSKDAFPDLVNHLAKYIPSPILSVVLWYDRPCLESSVIGMLGTQMEWAFSKSLLFGSHDQASPGYVTLLASAARELSQRPHRDLIALAHKEFLSVAPLAARATLRHARVICEHRATQSLPLGEPPMPSQTHIPMFLLAGDWVHTGLPATIESAVRSGFNAANLLHRTQK